MKKLLLLLTAFILSYSCMAQADSNGMKYHSYDQNTVKKNSKDYVMMKYEKMILMKDGKSMPMEDEMTMSNGSKVMTDGTVTKADGTAMKLNEGDCIYMDGSIVKMGTINKHDKSNMNDKK